VSAHTSITDEVVAQASAYKLGLLDTAEAVAFERHMEECTVCAREARAFAETVAEMAFSLPESRPSPNVRDSLMRGISPPPVTTRHGEGEWIKTPYEGIDVKVLFVDRATGFITTLMRMAPGAKYPPHHHVGVEHCYVIEGEIKSHDHTLRAGDYEASPLGSFHDTVTTDTGALMLMISNKRDRVFLPS
jgi:anti-sigma factor ChrR (cupin superfamily)